MADFLLEIGLEEVPARMIAGAEAELGKLVTDLLTRERLLGANGNVATYSTPRRLAVLVEDVLACQADSEVRLTGPSWKVAFKDGAPTAAAEAFAKKAGVPVASLEKITNAKGEYVGASVKRLGLSATQLLTAELPKEVLGLYWAKNMYWRAGKPERFVRPVRWVVSLLDSAVVPVEIAGIAAGNASRGHRVLHGDEPVVLDSPKKYVEALRATFVMVDVPERRHTIRKALDAATRTVAGARWREDVALIETVVHLTEWPSVVLGDFEPEYLALPEEVLVTVMRDHQKYFAVEGADGKLAPHFLAVLNTQVDDEGRAIIRHGNARVLRARFKDAQFFWDFDQKTPLAARVENLKAVTFQKELGSYYWKTEENSRVAKLLFDRLTAISKLPYQELPSWGDLYTAVQLSKTDLTTELVKEFTELQGVIGGFYARAQGSSESVAQAIRDQYKPASTEDAIPTTGEGQLLGLADRIQTITAMFGIGNAPTGSKDPFALRRAANGIVKILAESELPLTIGNVVDASGAKGTNSVQVAAFLRERLNFYLRDVRGFAYDAVNAVGVEDLDIHYPIQRADTIPDAIALAKLMTEKRDSEEFVAVCYVFKRLKRILPQSVSGKTEPPILKDFEKDLVEPEGIRLWDETSRIQGDLIALRKDGKFGDMIRLASTLKPSVDAFFDKPVTVMHDDLRIRAARLALVGRVHYLLAGIADFSEIVTA